ncbi:MAG TPA: ABC transporter ATP-binding protein [Pseudolabrys sp.]|nr:ABC transporter ATP-binding protein [Pseudolabrys sp.]
MSVLAAQGISIAFGGVRALSDVSFGVEAGEIFALIGPNGAGKTTLFNVVSGLYGPQQGTVMLMGEDVTGLPPHALARRGLSRTFQNLQIFFRMTASENVMVGRHLHERRNVLAHLFTLPSVLRQNAETRAKADELLHFVGIAGLAGRPAGGLPYGVLRRLEIARALATEPQVLLLDEPAAGCNPMETAEIDELIQKIAARGVAVVLVEHDMKLVMKISRRIHVLDQGRSIAEGSAEDIRSNAQVIAAYLGRHGQQEAVGA